VNDITFGRRNGIAMWWIEQSWRTGIARFRARGAGQSTVEYALVGALVVIAAAGALTLLGGELTSVFTNISKTLGTASGAH
jgi:Flp pilus assembly pilin Flp